MSGITQSPGANGEAATLAIPGSEAGARPPAAAAPACGPIGFWTQVLEDLRAYRWNLSKPGLAAILVYRLGHRTMRWPWLLRIPLALIYYPLFFFVRNVYGIELPYGCRIGRRVIFGHQHGIVLSHYASVGDDCIIRQNVTVGAADDRRAGKAPRLGSRVEIGAGAVIVGDIEVGDDVMIGANAVVITNVPANSLAVGVPAKVLPRPSGP
jgi:serine O-acetyltransferase